MANYEQDRLKSCLSKANLAPAVYDTSPIGNQGKKFRCRVSVKTFDYIGIGIANNKEQAESLAARDFIAHLEYKGLIQLPDLPPSPSSIIHDPVPHVPAHNPSMQLTSTHNANIPPVSTPNYATCIDLTLETQSEPLRCYHTPQGSSMMLRRKRIVLEKDKEKERERERERARERERERERQKEREKEREKEKERERARARTKETQIGNSTPVVGIWTVENCKGDLHSFAANHGIKLNYSYKQLVHKNSWNCILSMYVKQVGREFKAQGSGNSKKNASKVCALEVIGQLFHYGLIKPNPSTVSEKNRKGNEMTLPAPKGRGIENITFDKEKIVMKKRIGWCPPTPIWDAWLGRETTGLLCKMSLQQISIGLSICNSVHNSPMKSGIRYEQSILPVWNYRPEILYAINNNQVVFICGTIASGKATQVPQFILDDFIEHGDGALCNIIVTQHRHRSAISVAERIAYERCEHFRENSSVGFDIGHRRMIPRAFGAILFCTIDILLKKMEDGLRGISHIIIDELHEPNSNKEFLLNVLRGMIEVYPKLKVIFMAPSFGITALNIFQNCPIIYIHS